MASGNDLFELRACNGRGTKAPRCSRGPARGPCGWSTGRKKAEGEGRKTGGGKEGGGGVEASGRRLGSEKTRSNLRF